MDWEPEGGEHYDNRGHELGHALPPPLLLLRLFRGYSITLTLQKNGQCYNTSIEGLKFKFR